MERYTQLELFSKNRVNTESRRQISRFSFIYLYNYERIILMIIGFIVTGVVCFSLGVEKGKRSLLIKTNTELDLASKSLIQEGKSAISMQPATNLQEFLVEETKKEFIKESRNNYTIQVASFKTLEFARKEAEALKKKGFDTLVLSKGEYTIVCVGSFSDKQKAAILLTELKKHYRDCFIRRL
ncbi:MAG: SPOR domain-containing protein [Candidatus Omnitrophica bacterium]|nr:SPOR domain-containing protein [Candidatus Omnitrophota bacterium]